MIQLRNQTIRHDYRHFITRAYAKNQYKLSVDQVTTWSGIFLHSTKIYLHFLTPCFNRLQPSLKIHSGMVFQIAAQLQTCGKRGQILTERIFVMHNACTLHTHSHTRTRTRTHTHNIITMNTFAWVFLWSTT